jgi:hypothetical protein
MSSPSNLQAGELHSFAGLPMLEKLAEHGIEAQSDLMGMGSVHHTTVRDNATLHNTPIVGNDNKISFGSPPEGR